MLSMLEWLCAQLMEPFPKKRTVKSSEKQNETANFG